MKLRVGKILGIGAIAAVISLSMSITASAHVVVKPAEVVTAGFQTFTVGVPNEKEISTTGIKLTIPEGLRHVQPTQKTGWEISIETEGAGETALVKSITWSGNEVKAGFRDDFTFSAQVPKDTTELQWKAYQTYADGTVVAWDKANDESGHDTTDENSGPFSVTKVVSETANDAALEAVQKAAVEAKSSADTALYIGIAGVLLGLISIFLVTRKK